MLLAPLLLLAFDIHGIVRESGTNLPIAGAEITLQVQAGGAIRINGGWKDDPRKTTTDPQGAFTLTLDKPGQYRIEVYASGYLGPANSAEVTLTEAEPDAEVQFLLGRPARLTGMVADAETRKPLPGFHMGTLRKQTMGPLPWLYPKPLATGPDGAFTASNLEPGDYLVELDPQFDTTKRVLTKFTEADLKATDLDYERTYWPGGHGQDAAVPVTLLSGATLDLGALRPKKATYYRVHVKIPTSNCQPGDTMSIAESVHIGNGNRFGPTLGKAPCGKDVLITGYAPGTYRLILATEGRTAESRGTASVPFTVSDRNLEIVAPLNPPITITGEIVPADNAQSPDLTRLQIFFNPVDHYGFGDDMQPAAAPDSDGKFRAENLRALPHSIRITGLKQSNYVKEFRYNSVPLPGDVLPLETAAPLQSLTIVIDDKPAAITGTVAKDGKPVAEAYVMALESAGQTPTRQNPLGGGARTDANGKFRIAGLAPGVYRVVAVRELNPTPTSTAALEKAVTGGKKVELAPSATESITLELTDLNAK